MKLFATAFGIVCSVAAGLFGLAFVLLSSFEYAQAVPAAGTLATTVLLSFPKVAEFLEQQQGRKSIAAGRRKPVYDFRGFQIEWPLMVVYGTVSLVVLLQAAGFLAGFILSPVMPFFDSENASKFVAVRNLLTVVIVIFAAYFVGRWIGARISRLGIVTMLLIAALAPAAAGGLDVGLLSDESYRRFAGSERLAFFEILRRTAFTSFIIVVPGLIGYWRGQRQRLSKYLDYLLSVLPSQTRDTVVELAYEEAQKVSASVGDVRPSGRA
jgi:hypothetical protein